MRSAKIEDCWRHVDAFKKYPYFVDNIDIESVVGFSRLEIKVGSGITVFCGRNGSGKSTFLKIIYEILTKKNKFTEVYANDRNLQGVTVRIHSMTDGNLDYTVNDKKTLDFVEYFDPAESSMRIAARIKSDTNPGDFLEGVEPSNILSNYIEFVKKITGKKYTNIDVYELEGVFEGEIIPYIFVTQNGIKYSNETMGSGELKLLILLWKLLSLERSSVFLLEEPESFICPKSQSELINFIAYVADKKKICFILTSHSEYIISKVSQRSCFVLTDNLKKGFSLIPNKHSFKYIEALGLSSKKIGTILVEDDFAKRMLSSILSVFDSKIKYEYYIDILDGESNIEKFLKYNVCTENHKIIAIFDADHRGKIIENEYIWPIAYLPSSENYPPELTVVESIKADIKSYAQWINMREEDVEDKLSDIVCDHHDFFNEMSKSFEKGLSYLKDGAIDFWINKNPQLFEPFLFQLENIGQRINGTIIALDERVVFSHGDNNSIYELCSKSQMLDAQQLIGNNYDAELIYQRGVLVSQLMPQG